MSTARRFLLAPSLARLAARERGSSLVTEGYFPSQGGRSSHVRVEGGQCHLVLVTTGAGGASAEERTEVPRAHGEALLDVCAGRAVYDRSQIALGAGQAFVDRFTLPGALDLVSVVFETPQAAEAFPVPAWFGAEVSADPAYDTRAVALQGPPAGAEVPITNAALDALLDTFENRFAAPRPAQAPRVSDEDARVMDALRRLATSPADASEEAEPEAPMAENPPAPATELPVEAAPHSEAPVPERAESPSATPEITLTATEPLPADARIDDVIASLSQALGAATPARPAEEAGASVTEFERWTARARRSQG